MACEVNNKEINSQCDELLVRPTYLEPHSLLYLDCTTIKVYSNLTATTTVNLPVYLSMFIFRYP